MSEDIRVMLAKQLGYLEEPDSQTLMADVFVRDIGWVQNVVSSDISDEVMLTLSLKAGSSWFDYEVAVADVIAIRWHHPTSKT